MPELGPLPEPTSPVPQSAVAPSFSESAVCPDFPEAPT